MQFEEASEEVKIEKDGRMEVGGEMMDIKKKLDQRKRETVKQMRRIDDVTDLSQDFVDERKDMWRQELQQIEQRRNDLTPEHQKNAEVVAEAAEFARQKNCSVKRKWEGGLREMNRSELRLDKSQADVEDSGQQIQEESLVEAELDLVLGGLQAGQGRRGSNPSQVGAASMQPSWSNLSRREQRRAWQPLSQGELSTTFEVLHQPAPVTPVHVPK